MKNRLLPNTDLARVALLPADRKRQELLRFMDGKGRLSYAPFRDALPCIVNAQKTLIADLPPENWESIEAAIKRGCGKHANWVGPNLKLAKAVYDHQKETVSAAYERDFMPVHIGFGDKVKYWHDFYLNQDGKPVIWFIDPRNNYGLGTEGRRFAFSMMHHTLALGDFSEAQMQILHLRADRKGNRSVSVYELEPDEILSEEDINRAISDTYALWFALLAEKEEQEKRSTENTKIVGGLGF